MDIYVEPSRPDGVADSNWIQTIKGRDFMTVSRLYGTGIEFSDQTWKPGEIVNVM